MALRRSTGGIEPGVPGLTEAAIDRSYEHCRIYVKREAGLLGPALRVAPEPRRSALCSVYAWARRVADEVDSITLVEARRQGVDRVREQTERALAGDPPLHADPLWPGFAATVHAYRIPGEWTRAVLDAIAWRLANEPCGDEDGLRKGVLKLGAGLGMIAAAVCGLAPDADAKEAMRLARRRGAALQLVWILRDLGVDYDASPRRLCLPAGSYEDAGVRPHELRAWVKPAECERFVRGWAEQARRLLADSAGFEGVVAPDCAPMVVTLGRVAEGLLSAVEREPARTVRGARIDLPRMARTRLALGAALGRGRR